MPTYEKCKNEVTLMATEIIEEFDRHAPLKENGVKIDFLFAWPKYDKFGQPKDDAIKHHGVKALGLCRKVSLKDRAKGNGDAEILLDGDWWKDASEPEQRALLDHELYHIVPTGDTDDLRRPKLYLRPHDFQVGWFKVIALHHGLHSQERKQAALVMENQGQYYWPEMVGIDKTEAAVKAMRTRK